MESLRLDNVSKSFGGLNVLNGVSLTVEAGEKVAVIGPNGAGKTTLIKTITGELAADGGRVYLFGHDIMGLPIHRRIRSGLGRSFQITRLFYDLTVVDNVALAIRASQPSRYQVFRQADSYSDIFAEAETILKTVDLWDKKDELVSGISYGEQRRLEILLALASKPKVLLMDEPTVGLSTSEIADFISTIRALSEGTTVVFSAHDMNVVFSLADRVIVLYYGRLIAEGTPEEIRRNQEVRDVYLGKEEGVSSVGTS